MATQIFRPICPECRRRGTLVLSNFKLILCTACKSTYPLSEIAKMYQKDEPEEAKTA